MEIFTLKIDERKGDIGKKGVKRIRSEGRVPGVIYGAGIDPEYLEINEHDLSVFLNRVGEHAIIELEIGEEASKTLSVLADIQHHPVTDRILHVDFKRISRDKPIETMVPIEYVGTSVGVHAGGLFMPRLHELEIRAMLDDVPDKIEVDITDLDFDTAIHAKDLVVGEGIELLCEPEQTVATVVKPRGIEVEEKEEVEEAVEEEEAAEAPKEEE
ncbi:50S ribosomal protein L25 [bacterium]|nr:50S ribosomal protein L25 [bacterium]